MTTAFDREAAADRLHDLMFGDSRTLCLAGAAGWEGHDDEVFDDYADFERYCAFDRIDPDMVAVKHLRDYLFDVVRHNAPEVAEKVLSRFLWPQEVAAVIAAGCSAMAQARE